MPARTRMNGMPTSPLGRPDVVWGLPGQGGLLTEWAETVPDLTWPESVRTYGRMRRDSKITAVLNAFFLPLLRANWAVDPEGVTQAKAVDLVAADLGLPILGQKGPPPKMAAVRGFHWGEHLRLALLHNVYGFFPFERWYAAKSAKDGMTHLAGLDERLPYTIALIDLADDGQIRTVTQNTQNEPLNANRLLWYVHEREGANWAGVSMLRAAYTPWILKHETLRVHATSIRRWGMGIPVVKAPPGGTPGQIAEAQRLASGMRAGDQASAGLPDGFSFEVAGITGSIPDALGFLNFLNQEIASSALAAMLELGLSTGGSRALGDTFLDMFLLSLQAAANAVGDTCSYGVPAMPGISRALTDINFGEDEPCPRIVSPDVGDRHEITAIAIQQLVACGAIQPDDELEAFIREEWSFPARKTPRTPPPPPKGAPGQVPGPGGGGGGEGGGQPGPAGPGQPPPNPQPPSGQPATPKPPAGPPGRRGGQPATGPARTARAAAGPRRQMTDLEAAAGLDPEAMHADLEGATGRLLAQWAPVLKAQRADLADQVAAAVDDGQLDQLAALTVPAGDAAELLYRGMAATAAKAAGRVIGEAAGQGITIDLAEVRVNHDRLRQLAVARAAMAGQALAQAAARRALQVVTASVGTEAAREVTAVLHGLSPRPLADQLMAALHAAANEARFAVLEAGPEAVYTATELADDPNCCQPCKDVDGHQFASLDDARAAYANGAYIHCSGGLRCRGTVIATWPDTPFHLQVPGTADPWPHHLTPPPDLGPGTDVAAKFNLDQPRGHDGKWITGPDTGRPRTGRTLAHLPVTPITAAEARDGSRPVTAEKFQELAARGLDQLAQFDRQRHALHQVDDKQAWPKIKAAAYAETRKSWGGQTIEPNTGRVLPQGADEFALSVKPQGMATVKIPENATAAQFGQAMDEAKARFRGELVKGNRYLGIFHDDEEHEVHIDPVLVVGSTYEVETIGAYTHAIGGAYHFKTGDGYWPPHVAEVPAQVAAAADGQKIHWAGPGQWHTQADRDQPGLTAEQAAAIEEAGGGDPGPKGDAAHAAAPWNPAQHPRGPGGEWVHLDFTGMDHLLQSEFRPVQLQATQVKHPRSGWMVDAGISRSVSRPPAPDGPIPDGQLGPEGPPTFDLTDHGDPHSPEYNSLKYMGGVKLGTEPIEHVYRAMSKTEWDQARTRGYILSDKRGDITAGEGTNAAADPRDAASYLPRGRGVITKITVRPEDQWHTIGADSYLRTRAKIPLTRVEHAVEFRRAGKYGNEFAARPARHHLAPAAAAGAAPRWDEALHRRDGHGRFAPKPAAPHAGTLEKYLASEKHPAAVLALARARRALAAGDNARAAAQLKEAAQTAPHLINALAYTDLANKIHPGSAGLLPSGARALRDTPAPRNPLLGSPLDEARLFREPPQGTQELAEELYQHVNGEHDPDAKAALTSAATAFIKHDWTRAARLLQGAGDVTPDPDKAGRYWQLAHKIQAKHPPIGKLRGTKWTFDRAPRAGDRVADNWGQPGTIRQIAEDSKDRWAGIQFDDHRRMIVHLNDGEVRDAWQQVATSQQQERAWQRLSYGLIPYPPPPTLSPPGDEVAPGVKQLTLPGMPAARPVSTADGVARSLQKGIVSDHEQDTKPGENIDFETEGINYFGNTADTSIVTFADGSQWVRKRGIPEDSINKEIAYSRIANVLGIPAPQVVKHQTPDGSPEMYEPYVEGVTAIEWTGGIDPDNDPDELPDQDPDEMYNSPMGRLIGLTDLITNAADRHMGNWMVVADPAAGDYPVPIDNESASFGYGTDSYTPFAENLDQAQLAGEHPPEDWTRWEQEMGALRDEFDQLGMSQQLDNVLHNLDEMRVQAEYP